MDVSLDSRKHTFNNIVEEYEKIRPTYPKELFTDIFTYANVKETDRIFEIGCGTGKATEGFVASGYKNIDCVELGENLAKFTANKFQDEKDIHVYNENFETWNMGKNSYALAVSATAFHFINPDIGYPKVSQLLRKNGTMAFFWTYYVQPETEIFREIAACYDKYASHLHPRNVPTPKQFIEERTNLMKKQDLFQDIIVKEYTWVDTYTSNEYIDLIHTQSAHQLLPGNVKEKLFHSIHTVIENHGGTIEKTQFVALYLAKKK